MAIFVKRKENRGYGLMAVNSHYWNLMLTNSVHKPTITYVAAMRKSEVTFDNSNVDQGLREVFPKDPGTTFYNDEFQYYGILQKMILHL
jgi:L-rhamnose mutarotase